MAPVAAPWAQCATRTWGGWFNTRRLFELGAPVGNVPPAEFEARYHERAAAA